MEEHNIFCPVCSAAVKIFIPIIDGLHVALRNSAFEIKMEFQSADIKIDSVKTDLNESEIIISEIIVENQKKIECKKCGFYLKSKMWTRTIE